MVAVARYAAIGSPALQDQIVVRRWLRRPTSAPFAIASTPRGTSIRKAKVALSIGWSLQGNQVVEPRGCPTTAAPSSVGIQPSLPSPG
jgi:hypothetical protein